MLDSSSTAPSSEAFISCFENGNNTNKRKRRPAGTPDPDAEVVSLSPQTLLESDRYVCEICNQGFQRDQNLQMHRRRHKVPWKLLKRETPVVRKRVFVCPEPSCLHHDPCHALGDLVGIKKHYRRKHSSHKQWVCEKCSKGYAVQSDYKAHLKTCGTRGHSCDCGRVFSRVESFIEHQDACNMGGRLRPESQAVQPAACLSRTASSPSPSSDTNFSTPPPWRPSPLASSFLIENNNNDNNNVLFHNLELQLSTTTSNNPIAQEDVSVSPKTTTDENQSTHLHLSIGSSSSSSSAMTSSRLIKEEAHEQLKLAMAEKAYAEEARQQAKRQIELAEQEFANAKRIRKQAQNELDKAQALKEHSIKRINTTILRITCHSCKQQFQLAAAAAAARNNSSYIMSSSAETTADHQGEVENDDIIMNPITHDHHHNHHNHNHGLNT